MYPLENLGRNGLKVLLKDIKKEYIVYCLIVSVTIHMSWY